MEKVLDQGQVGDVKLSIAAGKVRIEAEGAVPGDVGVTAGAFIEADGEKLVMKLFAAIEAKSPPSVVAIEESVKLIVIQAVKSIQ